MLHGEVEQGRGGEKLLKPRSSGRQEYAFLSSLFFLAFALFLFLAPFPPPQPPLSGIFLCFVSLRPCSSDRFRLSVCAFLILKEQPF